MRSIWKTVSKSEKQWLLVIVLITIIMTSGPFLFAYLNTPIGGSYSGLHALTPGDTHVYYSLIEQAKQGLFLFEDLYTLEPHAKTLNVLWLAVGLGARVFNMSPELAYQIARIILLPVLIILIYLLISYFLAKPKERLFSLTLVIFSSGVGAWLYNILDLYDYTSYGYYHWPMDLWVAESNTYLTLTHSPHFIASLIGVLLIFLLSLLAVEQKNFKYSVGSGLTALVLFQFHPFQIFTTGAILGAFFLALIFSKREIIIFYLKHLLVTLLISAPTLAYYWWLLSNDWLTQQKALQNITLTPAWWLSIISYGFLWPAAIYGTVHLARGKSEAKWIFLLAWLPAQIILIYSPLVFQRRLTTGLHMVVALLAAFGLIKLYQILKKKYAESFLAPITIIVLVLTLTFSTLFNFAREIHIVMQRNQLLYFTQDENEFFGWIKANTQRDASFLTQDTYGNFIPGQTGRRVFVGHGIETAYSPAKFRFADWAYEQSPNPATTGLLQKNNINFVVFSVRENTQDSSLKASPALRQEFSTESIQVYSLLYE